MEPDLARRPAESARDCPRNVGITHSRLDDLAPTIFIVEDDVSVRQSLGLLIRTAGWEPQSFESADEFLSDPHDAGPCCLIVDLALSGLSGLALQTRLAGRRDMPIIFISSHTDVPMTVQAMKAGAVE